MKTKNIFRMLLVAATLLMGANNVMADDEYNYQYEGEVFANLTSTSTIRVNCSVTNIYYWQITFATINGQTPDFADWHGGTDWGAAWYYTNSNHGGYLINDSYFDLKCDQSTVNKLKNNGLKISTKGLTVTDISIDGSSASGGGGGTSTTDKTTPTLTFPQSSYNVTYGTTFDAPTATCNVDGLTISYGSSNPNVAEVASNGAVTIKAVGRATITASTPATDVYNAATASYQLVVSKANIELSYSPQEATATIGEAWTAPTLSNPSHVAVTYSSTNQNVATIDANGNVTLVGAGETWIKANYAGDNNYNAKEASYKLTVNGGPEIPEYISVNMGNYECRTYVTTTYIDFSQSVGIKGYYATGLNNEGTAVQFTKVTGVAPPHVPLLLQKISGAFEYKLRISDTENATAPSPNKLNAGSSNNVKSWIWGSNIYVLTVHNNQLVFAEVNDINNKAHVDEEHAYLDLNNSNAHARLTISFDDNNNGATGIDAIESNDQSKEVIYNLRGQRVQKPTKGVYIINGKKMVVK
jgi:hypothetical protein